MNRGRCASVIRSWVGILALSAAAIAAVWLVSVHIHARRITPVDKARIDDLKEKAKTDLEIQKTLQPEMNRQHEALIRRRWAYSRSALLLLISLAIFLCWHKWFRPEPGNWAGVPQRWQRFLEKRPGGPREADALDQPDEGPAEFRARPRSRHPRSAGDPGQIPLPSR
jgi:hypothetical protein